MKTMTRTLLMLAALMLCGCSGDNNEVMAQTMTQKLNITIGGETKQATLVDNAVTQELVARLQQSTVALSLGRRTLARQEREKGYKIIKVI